MQAFQLLSRGGVNFDKRRFKSDVELFDPEGRPRPQKKDTASEELPPELDFFKYAKGGVGKRKSRECDEDLGRSVESDEDKVKKRRKGDSDVVESQPNTQQHRVTTKGSNVPAGVDSFDALKERYNVSPRLLANLSQNGYAIPTGIQSHAIPMLLEGRDLAAISPTGTGKTLSYLLPIMSALNAPISKSKTGGSAGGVRAIVVAPTRELAHQIHNECLKLAQGRKWRIVLFSKANASTLADKDVRNKIDIIISTPLRLASSLQAGTLELDNVRHVILDEADRLLDSEFLPQIEEIVQACTHESLQTAVFSATLPAGAEKVAMKMLRNPIRVIVGLKDTPLPSISQSLTYVADESSKLPTLLMYLSKPYSPPLLVFTSTQTRASSLAENLVLYGVSNVDCLHAGMTQKERDDAVSRMRKGESWVMVSTEVMARGMDFKGVRNVINYDFPTSVQSYVHRVGRTGRAGREGTATTYFTNEDSPFLKPIVNVLLQSGSTAPEWMLKLPKPSKLKRREMGKAKRGDTVSTAGNIGKNLAVKKRDMIEGSKRRELKAANKRKEKNEEHDGQEYPVGDFDDDH